MTGQWYYVCDISRFCSFELHIFNYFACTIYTLNILTVQLTVHIAALLMHLLPVSKSGWILTSLRATIVDSCITFTVCWTATASNVTLHVGSDTVGCTRVVVSTRLKTCSRFSTIFPVILLDLEVATRVWVHVISTTNGSASWFHITNTTQTCRRYGSFTEREHSR